MTKNQKEKKNLRKARKRNDDMNKAYEGLDLSKDYCSRALVRARAGGELISFQKLSDSTLMDNNVAAQYGGWEDYLQKHRAELPDAHMVIFHRLPHKDLTEDDVALRCYSALLKQSKDRMGLGAKSKKSGDGHRASLDDRTYFIVKHGAEELKKLLDAQPPQAQTCYAILKKECGEKGDEGCVEVVLRAVVTKRTEDIKTRQDPWRIFQYYRPRLVEAGLIKHD